MRNNRESRQLHRSTATRQPSRRAFLKGGTLWLLGSAMGGGNLPSLEALDDSGAPLLRVGLLTDLHYADRPAAGTRYYRETLSKLRECVDKFNAIGPDFVVELGDLIDIAETVDGEVGHLKTIEAEYARLQSPRHYVLGRLSGDQWDSLLHPGCHDRGVRRRKP